DADNDAVGLDTGELAGLDGKLHALKLLVDGRAGRTTNRVVAPLSLAAQGYVVRRIEKRPPILPKRAPDVKIMREMPVK
ncbi:MAG TPA: hypothetical protein VF275_07335, partial [Gammaproteobacteria bacterium]